MLRLIPDPDLTDTVKLSDWLELQALVSPDGNSSAGDLQSLLRRAGTFHLNEDEEIEQLIGEVFRELRLRKNAADTAYPFKLASSSLLETVGDWHDYAAYVFCLLLSWTGDTGSGNNSPTQLFEEICRTAAEKYIDGSAIRFGWPRTDIPSAFSDAVKFLCDQIGEGGGYKEQPAAGDSSKDRKLDIVAWKHFPDTWRGKILLFGQCAAGKIIPEKLSELNPDTFCRLWLLDHIASPIINAAFIPHRLKDRQQWDFVSDSLDRALLFDRCRIAYWAHLNMNFTRHVHWCTGKLLSN